ncbi:restriction endonuclease subunit S [Saccharopolyspora sp. NPDC003752]
MSEIDRLLAEHCSDGVDVMTLGEIGTFVRGRRFTKADMGDEGIPCIHYGEIYTEYGVSTRNTVSYVREGLRDQLRYAQPGDVIIAGVGETVEDVGKAVAWLGLEAVAIHDDSFLFRSEIDPTYVSYYFQTSVFHAEKEKHVSRAKVKRLSSGGLSRITIPVPPLEVQREIVRILDKMTELQAALQAELQARARQYEYYRDSLLQPTDEVLWRPLGDCATIVRGASPRPIQEFVTDSKDGVPWIKIGDVSANGKYITNTAERVTSEGATKSRRVRPGDFVLSNSMSFGRPYICQIEGCIHDGWLAISDFEGVFVADFLYHMLRCKFIQAEFARRAGSGTVKNLNADIVKSVPVPVPDLVEQKRVVAVLDKFDALVNDLSRGLPAEIEARRKQYEYYRDKLLTFEEWVA